MIIAQKESLPAEREALTHRFRITDRDGAVYAGYLTLGFYSDGRLGEVFIRSGKSGSTEAWLDQLAISWSVALQHGVPIGKVFEKHYATQFDPYGSTSNPIIRTCSSITDYIARYLLSRYAPMPPDAPPVVVLS